MKINTTRAATRLLIATLCLCVFFHSPLYADMGSSLTVTDLKGREISLPAPAERIVAMRSALGLISYMQLTTKIVGVEDLEVRASKWLGSVGRSYRLANPQLAKLPVIGSRNQPDIETLIMLAPDVIFLGSGDIRFADNLQKKTGIPVVFVDNGNLSNKREEFYTSLRVIGKLCAQKQRATEIIQRINIAVDDLQRRTRNIEMKPTVYIGGMNFRVAHGLTGTSSAYPPFQLLNIKNIADDMNKSKNLVKGRFQIDPEVLIAADPTHLFICESGLELVKADLEKPVFQSLQAINNRRVFGIIPHYYAASPDTVLAETYYMGTVLFPEEFADINVPNMADSWYQFFVGKSLYADMKRIFGGFGPLDFN